MTPERVLSELFSLGVTVETTGPDAITLLSVYGPVPTDAIELARRNKSALIEHIRPSCQPHNDPANYFDRREGNRIRTTCRKCGRFIGYRPADPEQQRKRR